MNNNPNPRQPKRLLALAAQVGPRAFFDGGFLYARVDQEGFSARLGAWAHDCCFSTQAAVLWAKEQLDGADLDKFPPYMLNKAEDNQLDIYKLHELMVSTGEVRPIHANDILTAKELSYCIGTDKHPSINGLQCYVGERLFCAATDGKRVAMNCYGEDWGGCRQVFIPTDSWLRVKILDSIFNPMAYRVCSQEGRHVLQGLNGSRVLFSVFWKEDAFGYPNVTSCIFAEYAQRVTVSTGAFISEVDAARAAIGIGFPMPSIRLSISATGGINISARGFNATINATKVSRAEALMLCADLNPNFVLDTVRCINKDSALLEISLSDGCRPILFKSPDHNEHHVIMPMVGVG